MAGRPAASKPLCFCSLRATVFFNETQELFAEEEIHVPATACASQRRRQGRKRENRRQLEEKKKINQKKPRKVLPYHYKKVFKKVVKRVQASA